MLRLYKFSTKLGDVILKINNSKCSFYIAGDFNINLSKENSDPKVSNYLNKTYYQIYIQVDLETIYTSYSYSR